jgi:predicted  nucleic acid-binding Zn-ribbon protein
MDKKLFAVALALFITAWLILIVPARADTVYTLEGYVYDVTNNKPLEDALVQIIKVKPAIVKTVRITISENYEVTVVVDGVQAQVLQVYVGKTFIRIYFVYNGINVLFKIKKVASVTIVINISLDGDSYVVQTNEQGYWTENVEAGKYYIYVSKGGYCSYLDYLDVESNLTLTTYLMQLVEKTALELRVEALENLIPIIFGRLDNIDREISVIYGEIGSLKDRVTSLEQRMTSAEENIENLRAELDWTKQRLASDEERISQLEKDVQNIYNIIAGIQENIEGIRARLDNLEARTQVLENKVCVLEEWRIVVDQRLQELFGRVENLEIKTAELDRRVTGLEQRMDEAESKISQLEQNLYQLGLRVAEIEKEITIPKEIPRVKVEGTVMAKVCDNVYEPLRGELVWIVSYNLVPMATYTDDTGHYRFENVVADEVSVRCRDLRYTTVLTKDAFVRIVYDENENKTYVVSRIWGKLYLDGLATENTITVYLRGEKVAILENFSGGVYCFDGIPVGQYTVYAYYKTEKGKEMKAMQYVTLTHEPLQVDLHLSEATIGWVLPVATGTLIMVGTLIALLGAGALVGRRVR